MTNTTATIKPRIFFCFNHNPYTISGNVPTEAREYYDHLYHNQLSTSVRESSNGNGLFAKEVILAGEYFLEYAGERVTKAEFNERAARYESYGWSNEYFQQVHADLHIDATVVGNNARFINHSCEPNCEVQAVDLNNSGYCVSWLRALKTIQPGTEIRSDYQWHFYDTDSLVICECGAESCRNFI